MGLFVWFCKVFTFFTMFSKTTALLQTTGHPNHEKRQWTTQRFKKSKYALLLNSNNYSVIMYILISVCSFLLEQGYVLLYFLACNHIKESSTVIWKFYSYCNCFNPIWLIIVFSNKASLTSVWLNWNLYTVNHYYYTLCH